MTGGPNPYAEAQHRPLCLQAAEHILAEREAGDPTLVASGRLTADAAAERLAVARALVAQWQWIAHPAAPPCPAFDPATGEFGVLNHVLVDATAQIAAGARARAARFADRAELEQFAQVCEAIAWLQQDRSGSGSAAIVLRVDVERRALAAPARPARQAA